MSGIPVTPTEGAAVLPLHRKPVCVGRVSGPHVPFFRLSRLGLRYPGFTVHSVKRRRLDSSFYKLGFRILYGNPDLW